MTIREYNGKDLSAMIAVWNEVVEDGIAFPQEELLDSETGAEFFASQTYCGVDMMDADENGLYFLTAKGKSFYKRLIQSGYLSLTALKGESTLTRDRDKLLTLYEKGYGDAKKVKEFFR